MELIVLLALWLFAIVHVDTFLVLTAFCADEQYGFAEVLVGHYLGFAIGLLAAVGGAIVAAEIFEDLAFLLGVVPIALGMWAIWRRAPEPDHDPLLPAPGPWRRMLVVTATGIGLSGENIAVFIPFFVQRTIAELSVIVIVYLVAAGVVFTAAWLVGSRLLGVRAPTWVASALVPTFLILVGMYVILAGWVAL